MGAIGIGLLLLGGLGVAFGLGQLWKSSRIAGAPLVRTGDAARAGFAPRSGGGAISVEGKVSTANTLQSPYGNESCLYWEFRVTASWQEDKQTKSKEVARGQHAVDFALDDGSGPIYVDAKRGGDIDTEGSYDREERDPRRHVSFSEDVHWNTAGVPEGASYHLQESVLKPPEQLYVRGKLDGGALVAPGWGRDLLVSTRSRDALLGGAVRWAKILLLAGGAFAIAGGVVTVMALMQPRTVPVAAPASTPKPT